MKGMVDLSKMQSCPFQNSESGNCNLTGKYCSTWRGKDEPDTAPNNCPLRDGVQLNLHEDGSKIFITKGE